MRISTLDPITLEDVTDLENAPFIMDGDLKIYFQSEANKAEYLDIPMHTGENSPGLKKIFDDTLQPEKTWRSLDADHLLRSYALNAVGPALLIKHVLAKLNPKHPTTIGILSARVGSISDNRLGGWHSYRASKAALNMLIKNFAIELQRMKRPTIIVGLQPGTTDTALSEPFKRNVPPDHLQTPEFTASHLLKVMQQLRPKIRGNCLIS